VAEVSFDIAGVTTPDYGRPRPEAIGQVQKGLQGPTPEEEGNEGEGDWQLYSPTATSAPNKWGNRPRTIAARYSEKAGELQIQFRTGAWYSYSQVPPSVWGSFVRSPSPGTFINSTLNTFPYGRGGGGSIVGE
jgi:hypothetical protein